MSEDRRDGPQGKSDRSCQTKNARSLAATDAKKDRLATALRENLKRRKAQISARRQDIPPE
jgi:hypothetical protein